MHDILYSPYIVPLGAFVAGIAYIGIGAWKKIREQELTHDREMRLKEMEHQLNMKQKELEMAQTKTSS